MVIVLRRVPGLEDGSLASAPSLVRERSSGRQESSATALRRRRAYFRRCFRRHASHMGSGLVSSPQYRHPDRNGDAHGSACPRQHQHILRLRGNNGFCRLWTSTMRRRAPQKKCMCLQKDPCDHHVVHGDRDSRFHSDDRLESRAIVRRATILRMSFWRSGTIQANMSLFRSRLQHSVCSFKAYLLLRGGNHALTVIAGKVFDVSVISLL